MSDSQIEIVVSVLRDVRHDDYTEIQTEIGPVLERNMTKVAERILQALTPKSIPDNFLGFVNVESGEFSTTGPEPTATDYSERVAVFTSPWSNS